MELEKRQLRSNIRIQKETFSASPIQDDDQVYHLAQVQQRLGNKTQNAFSYNKTGAETFIFAPNTMYLQLTCLRIPQSEVQITGVHLLFFQPIAYL